VDARPRGHARNAARRRLPAERVIPAHLAKIPENLGGLHALELRSSDYVVARTLFAIETSMVSIRLRRTNPARHLIDLYPGIYQGPSNSPQQLYRLPRSDMATGKTAIANACSTPVLRRLIIETQIVADRRFRDRRGGSCQRQVKGVILESGDSASVWMT
jgi:hypothetical protein